MSNLASPAFTSLFFAYLDSVNKATRTTNNDSIFEPYWLILANLKQQASSLEETFTLEFEDSESRDFDNELQLEKIKMLLDFFLIDCVFTEARLSPYSHSTSAFNIADVLLNRTGSQAILSLFFIDFARHLGFSAHAILTPGPVIIRLALSNEQFVFIDAATGQSLDWPQIEALYLQDEQDVPEIANVEKDDYFLISLLSTYKASLLAKNKLSEALVIAEALLSIEPENPYLRRDRGYLLDKLECKPLALADFDYFIKMCPDDPMAQLLESQLGENFNAQVTFH